MLQPASQSNAKRGFERFRETVEHHAFADICRVTVSVGICHLLSNETPTAVIDRADAALY